LLAGIAAGLCILERTHEGSPAKVAANVMDRAAIAAPRGATWYAPWR